MTQSQFVSLSQSYIVCIPRLSAGGGGGGGLSLQPNLKKEGLTGPQLLEGVAGKEGGDFFRGEGEGRGAIVT